MYCPACGKPAPDGSTFCGACGAPIGSQRAAALPSRPAAATAPSTRAGTAVRATSSDALSALKAFGRKPVSGLPEIYSSLGESRSMGVGIAFGVLFGISLAFLIGSLAGSLQNAIPLSGALVQSPSLGTRLKAVLVGLVVFGCFGAAVAATRHAFRGSGSLQADALVAGTALVPLAVFNLAVALLGVANFEVIAVLALFALCYTILVLYSGATTLSRIPELAGAAAVPLTLILAAWLTKVLLVSLG